MLDELVAAGHIRRHLLSADPDQPSAPVNFEHLARRQLRRHGQVITDAAVVGRVAELTAYWPKIETRMAEHRGWRVDALSMAPRIVAVVAKVRTATGAGPTWLELGDRVYHWQSRSEITVRLGYLVHTGWPCSTREARSTDVGPLGRHYLASGGNAPPDLPKP
jgi:hypothetical protein